MKVGFFTAILRNLKFEQVLEWASKHGFELIEVYSAPGSPHIDPSKDLSRASEIKKLLEKYNVGISAISYHPNNLHPDLEKRKEFNEHLKKCIEMAYKLEVNVVSTFAGSPAHYLSADLNYLLDEFEKVFKEIVKYAEDRNVKIAFENCPAGGWNLAYNPTMWDLLFERVPSDNLGLNLDPSHLVWQFIDYVSVARKYGKKIFHTHAKDTEVLYDKLSEVGIYGRGWWRYRIPGWGEIDWRAYITALREGGYDFVLSIEHEDPVFKPIEGVLLGKKYLENILKYE